jgi:hypothetical protein
MAGKVSLLGQHKPKPMRGKLFCAVCRVIWPCLVAQERVRVKA